MSKKTIDVELLEAIENFVDAKLAFDWVARHADPKGNLFLEAQKQVDEKRKEMHTRILQLTWVASAR